MKIEMFYKMINSEEVLVYDKTGEGN